MIPTTATKLRSVEMIEKARPGPPTTGSAWEEPELFSASMLRLRETVVTRYQTLKWIGRTSVGIATNPSDPGDDAENRDCKEHAPPDLRNHERQFAQYVGKS